MADVSIVLARGPVRAHTLTMNTATTERMQVANEILRQLGGNRFRVMTGATSFSGGDDRLSFRVPVRMTKNGIKAVVVKLDADDTYTMTFYALKPAPTFGAAIVSEASGLYAEDLCRVFTEATGLATSL